MDEDLWNYTGVSLLPLPRRLCFVFFIPLLYDVGPHSVKYEHQWVEWMWCLLKWKNFKKISLWAGFVHKDTWIQFVAWSSSLISQGIPEFTPAQYLQWVTTSVFIQRKKNCIRWSAWGHFESSIDCPCERKYYVMLIIGICQSGYNISSTRAVFITVAFTVLHCKGRDETFVFLLVRVYVLYWQLK